MHRIEGWHYTEHFHRQRGTELANQKDISAEGPSLTGVLPSQAQKSHSHWPARHGPVNLPMRAEEVVLDDSIEYLSAV